jgi:hypothetical protein
MMGPLWNARFVAKVLGIPAVMLGGIFAFPWLAKIVLEADAPDGLKYFIIALFALPVLGAIAFRLCRGGEQGPTDIVIEETPTTRRITATNVHFAGGPTGRALEAFERMPSVPRPIGRVTGNPSSAADLIVDAMAALPERVAVAETPLEVPQEAQSVEGGAPVPLVEVAVDHEKPTDDPSPR